MNIKRKTQDEAKKCFKVWAYKFLETEDPNEVIGLLKKVPIWSKTKREELILNKENQDPSGEALIEDVLLSQRVFNIEGHSVVFFAKRVALTKQKAGQIIPDLLGVARLGNKLKLIVAEIKVTDADAYYALRENLRQLRVIRGCYKLFKKNILAALSENISESVGEKAEILQQFKESLNVTGKITLGGCWGVVIAPDFYYLKKRGNPVIAATALLKLVDSEKLKVRCVLMGFPGTKPAGYKRRIKPELELLQMQKVVGNWR